MTHQEHSLQALRAAFPSTVIGKLPKGGVDLDFVGHAAVTDRLLSVDPEWSWEPFATDEHGLPALDSDGNLWIRLTVLGVTRIGVGDGATAKIRIGDAIRNAAMRFGVALDLWTKNELELKGAEDAVADPQEFYDRIAQAQSGQDFAALAQDIAKAPLTRTDRDSVRNAWSKAKQAVKR